VVGLKVKVGDAVAVLQAAAEAFIVAAGALVLPLAPRLLPPPSFLSFFLVRGLPDPAPPRPLFLDCDLSACTGAGALSMIWMSWISCASS